MRRYLHIMLVGILLVESIPWRSTARADEFVDNAASGQSFGGEMLYGAASSFPTVQTQMDPNGGHSTPSTIYVPELVPGAGDSTQLQSFYDDPEGLSQAAINNQKAISGAACPTTHFYYQMNRVVLRGDIYTYKTVDGTREEHSATYTGTIAFSAPTLGSDRTHDTILRPQQGANEGVLVRFRESPYTVPADGTYFTYAHTVQGGGGWTVTSYGSVADSFRSVGTVYLANTGSFTLTASLYQAKTTYSVPPDATPCPPWPPGGCTLDGVSYCDAKSSGIASVFTVQSYLMSATDSMVTDYYYNPNTDLSTDTAMLSTASLTQAIMVGADTEANALFAGCSVTSDVRTTTATSHQPDYTSCTGAFTGFEGCSSFSRSLVFQPLDTKVTLTITQYAYDYGPPPIIGYNPDNTPIYGAPPIIGEHQVNLTGTHSLAYPTMGSAQSSRVEITGGYVRYENTPFYGTSDQFTYNHTVQGAASAQVTSYGSASDGWKTQGTATADGTQPSITVTATRYQITSNQVADCQEYILRAMDGWCSYAIHCTDQSSCRTVDGVTFCEGSGPASGIVGLIETYVGAKGVGVIPAMCFAGYGDPMTCTYTSGDGDCYTDAQGAVHCPHTEGGLTHHDDIDPPGVADDCEIAGIYANPEYTYVRSECDENQRGTYSGECYIYDIVYDHGRDIDYEVPTGVSYSELCSGAVRCMGTECHNPGGECNADMTKAVTATEMIQMMQSDMVCAETGDAPTNTSEPCTPIIFGGENQTCKKPIGREVGLTPDCCEEGEKAAAGVDYIAYLQLAIYGSKVATNPLVVSALSGIPGYSAFTDLVEPLASPLDSAFSLANEYLVDPMVDAIEHMGYEVVDTASEEVAKKAASGLSMSALEQKIMMQFYDFIAETLGLPELADALFTVTSTAGTTSIALNATVGAIMDAISIAYLVYESLKILGHIVFACTEDELQLGINRKVGNCTYIGSYCSMNAGFTCIEKQKSYCCYNSSLARIVMEQARVQLGGFGDPEAPNCEGLTIDEMAEIDWDQIDLSEWMALLEEANIVPSTPEEAAEIWGLDTETSKSNRAYGMEPPGPNGEVSKTEVVEERYGEQADKMDEGREELSEQPTCYSDPKYMAWYVPKEIRPEDVIKPVGGTGLIRTCGDDDPHCIEIVLGKLDASAYYCGSKSCVHLYEENYVIEVLRPDLITSAELLYGGYEDHARLTIGGQQVYVSPNFMTYYPAKPGANTHTDFCVGDYSYIPYCTSHLAPSSAIDITSAYKVSGELDSLLELIVGYIGEGYFVVRVHYDPPTPPPEDMTCYSPS